MFATDGVVKKIKMTVEDVLARPRNINNMTK